MTLHTVIVLLIGTGAMLLPMLLMMKWYSVPLWKSLPIAVLLTVTGTLSTYIWFFLENLWFGGRSFYGAVFLVPIVFIFVAKLMKLPHEVLMDFCAPAECVMLAIMKQQCLIDGCCGGKLLHTEADGTEVLFPSQIAELVNALAIMVILLIIARGKKNRGNIFQWYMILYGVSRFVLNGFREENVPYALGLPAGSFWSLVSVIIGITWLCYGKSTKKKVSDTT